MIKLRRFSIALLFLIGVGSSIAAQGSSCGSYQRIGGYSLDESAFALCKVASGSDVSWSKPRKIAFADANTLLVTDMGSWGSRSRGKLWKLDINTLKSELIYKSGDRTHGLAIDKTDRILLGDADAILREADGGFQIVVGGLPEAGNHPLTHFILLPNQDLVVNIGAPSDQCLKEMKSSAGGLECSSRDKEAELRLYSFDANSDSYKSDYRVIGRGLRNSMALEFNPNTNQVYQSENNIDRKGTAEEFNVIDLTQANTDVPDYGWPFCTGFGVKNPAFGNSFKTFCAKKAKNPLFLVPAHSAPLDMQFYKGELTPELINPLIMSWHGHSRTLDYALVAYKTNKDLSPYLEGGKNNSFIPLLRGSNAAGKRLSPVGIATDPMGRIWFIDDKTGILYMLTPAKSVVKVLPTEKPVQLTLTQDQRLKFAEIYDQFRPVETCSQCHSTIISDVAEKTLALMIKNRWLTPASNVESMPFIGSMMETSELFRAMPPSPEPIFEAAQPEIFNSFYNWAKGLNP